MSVSNKTVENTNETKNTTVESLIKHIYIFPWFHHGYQFKVL